jgi:hypothetical protein
MSNEHEQEVSAHHRIVVPGSEHTLRRKSWRLASLKHWAHDSGAHNSSLITHYFFYFAGAKMEGVS